MKKLKSKIIRKTIYHQTCEDLEECVESFGFPQHPILQRHGMVYIGFDSDYFFLAYVDSKKWKTKKVKKLSHKRLFKNLIKEKL